MTDPSPTSKKPFSADWLFRGILTKFGDTVDAFTGRRWVPSSSLATSELIERLKKLLDAEARHVLGKGYVVPHNISLRMQWDKFSEDSESSIEKLRSELLAAAADHINDSLYYTLAPLDLEVKTDYFTEGVKLTVSFDKFEIEGQGVEMNVTMPSVNVTNLVSQLDSKQAAHSGDIIARFTINGLKHESRVRLAGDGRISVGRTPENGLVIDDPSVSKTHASIVVVPGSGLSVADTGSTNGTFVNGERLAYGKAAAFDGQDSLKFGSVDVAIDWIEPVKDKEAPATVDNSATTIGGFQFHSRASDTEHDDTEPSEIPRSTHEVTFKGEDQVLDDVADVRIDESDHTRGENQ